MLCRILCATCVTALRFATRLFLLLFMRPKERKRRMPLCRNSGDNPSHYVTIQIRPYQTILLFHCVTTPFVYRISDHT